MSDTDARAALRRAVADLLDARAPLSGVRRTALDKAPRDGVLWQRMGDELGLVGLIFPEEVGGSGAGIQELVVVLEEMGQVVLDQPYFSNVVLAGQLLDEAGTPETRKLLTRMVDGEITATVALPQRGHAFPSGLPETLPHVLDGGTADLVLAVTQGGAELVAVPLDLADRVPGEPLDGTRPSCDIRQTAPGEVLASGPGLVEAVGRWVLRAALANAAEQAGVARTCLELAVDYAKVRVQFDRPIGANQALQHELVKVLAGTVGAEAAVRHAAAAWDEGRPEAAELVLCAAAHSGPAAVQAARAVVHVHGGTGFTWEHDAHLLYRRATWSAGFLGGSSTFRTALAPLLTAPSEHS